MTARTRYRSPVGTLTIEVGDEGLIGLRFGAQGTPKTPVSSAENDHLEAVRRALKEYFAGRVPRLPRLDLRGSEFQLAVWRALLEIPWGETRTYGEVAARIGRPGSARAVGGANHENPIPILVPCHRVVASGGALGGYGGGLDRKRWLLAHEAHHGPLLRLG
ncbi:MAG TPA: methylated-DNA--[protein]-cysteine S-methyltransferase [Anaeromyxobacteraceae bacterium]|nr:methylated-DNA--[protein]-cysteine S-methyltransferase [Anaeromyxobacteraceae bacterium]